MTSDYIIIGGGPGGYEVAHELASAGKTVVLVEKDRLGGTCLNRGCIPTKALAAAAERLLDIRSAPDFGIAVADCAADYAAAHRRAEEVVATLRADVEQLLAGVTLVRGEACFVSDSEVAVGVETYSAPSIIIATGSAPAPLRCPGAENALTSDEFLAMEQLPVGPVVIVGGGVIGLEFASILAAYGVEVSVVEFCKEVLPGIDSDLAKRLRQALTKRGITFYCGTAVEEIAPGRVVCSSRKGPVEIAASTVVAAVGRRAVLPPGLENTSVKLTERGFVEVDPATYRTAAEGIWAVGDVNGLCMLAHAAGAQARRAVGLPSEPELIPAVVFTTPQLATVGTGEGTTVRMPYGSNGKALADGHAEGVLKLTVDPADGRIAGCSVLGAHAADLVAEATVAISAGFSPQRLAAVTHAHPSLSEILQAAALKFCQVE